MCPTDSMGSRCDDHSIVEDLIETMRVNVFTDYTVEDSNLVCILV